MNSGLRVRTLKSFFYYSLLIIHIIFYSACSNDKVEPPKSDITASDSIPSQESFNSTVTFSDSGKVKAILEAGRIRVFSKSNYTLIDSNAKVDFYKNGVFSSTLDR